MSTPAAAWYPSPDNANVERWWDGRDWTPHTRPPVGGELPTQRTESGVASGELVSTVPAAQHAGSPQAPPQASTARVGQSPARPAMRSAIPRRTAAAPTYVPVPPPDVPPAKVRREPRRAVSIVALVVGLLAVVVGSFAALSSGGENRVQGDETTMIGTIFEHDTKVAEDGSSTCTPVAAFTIGLKTFRAESATPGDCLRIGTAVTVIYNIADPGDLSARIQESDPTHTFLWAIPAVGLGMVLVALRRLGVLRRRRSA
jgi:Protein of unknown function (DUF2510)/Protein of unknown function (DUF3592)